MKIVNVCALELRLVVVLWMFPMMGHDTLSLVVSLQYAYYGRSQAECRKLAINLCFNVVRFLQFS